MKTGRSGFPTRASGARLNGQLRDYGRAPDDYGNDTAGASKIRLNQAMPSGHARQQLQTGAPFAPDLPRSPYDHRSDYVGQDGARKTLAPHNSTGFRGGGKWGTRAARAGMRVDGLVADRPSWRDNHDDQYGRGGRP